MLVCGIDFETTGLDSKKDRPIEVAAVVFDTEKNFRVVSELSYLIYSPEYPALSEEVKDVTGITDGMLMEKGVPFMRAMGALMIGTQGSEYFIAHNKEYDRDILQCEFRRQELPESDREVFRPVYNRPFLCTIDDIDHPPKLKCKKLSHLALDYGVPVDPAQLHRSLGDVRLMGEILGAIPGAIEKMIAMSETPWVYVQAVIPAPWTDDGVGKAGAQARGYRWEKYFQSGPEYPKKWIKRIKEDKVEEEAQQAPFPVRLLD